jgi:hypothetical protein
MQELVKAGADPKGVNEMVPWLCGPLNKAAILVLVAIIGLSLVGRKRRSFPTSPQA